MKLLVKDSGEKEVALELRDIGNNVIDVTATTEKLKVVVGYFCVGDTGQLQFVRTPLTNDQISKFGIRTDATNRICVKDF
jgi:hypothetical protein